jgi:hypothetical protein
VESTAAPNCPAFDGNPVSDTRIKCEETSRVIRYVPEAKHFSVRIGEDDMVMDDGVVVNNYHERNGFSRQSEMISLTGLFSHGSRWRLERRINALDCS